MAPRFRGIPLEPIAKTPRDVRALGRPGAHVTHRLDVIEGIVALMLQPTRPSRPTPSSAG